ERLSFMLSDAGAPVLVTQAALRAQLPAIDTRIVYLDGEDAPAIACCLESAPQSGLTPHNPAYVIYTSGSTATPKRVVVTHAGLRPLTAMHVDRLAITSEARILQFASLSFDAAISELATALASGAALVLTAERHGDALTRLIREESVTHALVPPVLLADLPE